MKNFLKKAKHLLEYFLVIIIIRALRLLGITRSSSLCSSIARKIGPLLSVDRIARRNVQFTFPNTLDIERIIDGTWDNFGRFVGEFPYVGQMSTEELDQRIEITGLKNISIFQQLKQPFVLFTGHFANWDIALKVVDKFYPKFAVVYRKANNPYINNLINKVRNNTNLQLIPKGARGVKSLIHAIKSGHSIIMLVDQKMNDGIEVPFLGRPAMTPNAIAKLALQFKYPIVPCQIIRTRDSYFKIIVHIPLKLQQTGDETADCYNIMCNINNILGDWVKQNPMQWFWFHNRWGK